MKHGITPSLEDYLETILFIFEQNGIVRVTDVAARMEISKPSVNKAINTLKKQELVSHERYGHLHLTQSGEEIAKTIAKRHLMLKKFLVEIIGVCEEVAEHDACLIEHAISPETAHKMEEYVDKVFEKNKN